MARWLQIYRESLITQAWWKFFIKTLHLRLSEQVGIAAATEVASFSGRHRTITGDKQRGIVPFYFKLIYKKKDLTKLLASRVRRRWHSFKYVVVFRPIVLGTSEVQNVRHRQKQRQARQAINSPSAPAPVKVPSEACLSPVISQTLILFVQCHKLRSNWLVRPPTDLTVPAARLVTTDRPWVQIGEYKMPEYLRS